jgi:hypothetical protein
VKAGLVGLAVISLGAVLLAAPGHGQSPPPLPAPGFMPPYEVTKTVRSAGFEPLAPPLREGTTYVLRATDFRGILMRVVVDAHSGAIRAVNRIVPGPGSYGPVGVVIPAPYGTPPPYGLPPDAEGSELPPTEAPLPPPPLPSSALRPNPRPSFASPPLPRPRPAELASREAKPAAKPAETPMAKPVEPAAIKPTEAPVATPEVKPSATATTPAPAPTAPKRPPPPAIPD